ncbi:Fic family protein [Moraxella osloensis]|uniref:Fic family protein n=1 Tax=Faucicola osloensis TaxID=34062 RepID=UPI00242C5B55|nr:Fic family protein [Moraxella osloensis]
MLYKKYIHEYPNWTDWQIDNNQLLPLVANVRLLQGKLLGKMQSLGFELPLEAQLDAVTLEVIKTSEIEGEILNNEQVRSSVARHLGIEHLYDPDTLVTPTREIDAIVEMMLRASFYFNQPLTLDEIFAWHRALFPTGFSGLYKIQAGRLRDDRTGAMQVVSGGYGRTKVHFEAPAAQRLPDELAKFIAWYNDEQPDLDLTLKAGIAHLWFVTLHPFEDGNGRLTRAITERMLAKSDGSGRRFYSMSAQILATRSDYYMILESTQKGLTSTTDWLVWFLQTLDQALTMALTRTQRTVDKAQFWHRHRYTTFNERQVMMINRLWGDFFGKLTTKKWAMMTKTSPDTALRDINDLVDKGILIKSAASGRSQSYELSANDNS